MSAPLADVLAAMALIDETPLPEPVECHTTTAGFAALRALLVSDDWTERVADVAGLPPSLDRINVYEDPEMIGKRVEFRRSDGTVVAEFDLAPASHRAGETA